MSVEKEMAYFQTWWKRLERKLLGKPQAMAILQRRTMNIAISIVSLLEEVDFSKLSFSLYFFCDDVRILSLTRAYEAQIELASIDPEKFAFGLHKFYNDLTARIKKEDLYSESFELYYRCTRKRIENDNAGISDDVMISFLNLLTQHTEYLKPDKFNIYERLVGRKTTGELMTMRDPLPTLDLPSYELQTELLSGKTVTDPREHTFALYRKYGYNVHTESDLEVLN